jgi:hypothetical protein
MMPSFRNLVRSISYQYWNVSTKAHRVYQCFSTVFLMFYCFSVFQNAMKLLGFYSKNAVLNVSDFEAKVKEATNRWLFSAL